MHDMCVYLAIAAGKLKFTDVISLANSIATCSRVIIQGASCMKFSVTFASLCRRRPYPAPMGMMLRVLLAC